MPDFKELVKNLYATKGRELTEEKLSYIETNYGKGKEEEFVKNFYATIGEELPQEKFDYIRDTYLKKKEDGGIPYRTPSAPVAPSFGTPSVVEASEQLESQSKLTPPRIKGVSVKSPLEGIKGAPPPTTEYGLIPEGKEKKKSLFEIEKLPSESNASIERLNQNAELQTKLLNDPSYALLSDSDEKRKKIYTEKNKAVAEQRNQTLDELYSDMDEYLADFLPENDKKEYTGLRDRVDLLKKINQAKVNGQPTENLEKQYDEMVTAFSEAKAKRISDADSQIKQLRLSLEETPVQEQQPILDEIRLLEASKKPFFTDKKQAAAQIVMQEGLQGNKSDQEKLREYAHALMRERSDLREMLGMKGARRTIGESVVDMTIGGDDAVLQRLTDVETKLKSIAPIVLINETPLVEKEGALKVLGKEFMGSLAPTTKAIIPTQQSVAQNTLQGLELAGVDLNNISKEAISTIEKTSKPYEDWSAKDFAQMSGTTFGFMPKFVIASAVTEGVGGLSAVSPYWRSIKILAERGSLGNKVNNNVLAALQANKYGRGFLKTAFSGVEFGIQSEVESRIFQADKDEVNAVTGGTGGTLGKIFGIGIEKASNITSKAFSTVMTSLFGNKSIDATNKVLNFAKTAYSKTKTVNEKAVGEVGEETGESLANLYQESENGQQFFDKVAEQYGDVSKGLKFFLSTYMMGAAFGSGTYFGRWSTNKSAKLYNDLSPKEKAVADNIISDIRQEQNKAETDAAIDAIKESDLPEDKKDELIKDANKQGEIINNVIEDKANASELEQFAPTEKEQIKEEYDRAKEPIIGRTDVTQEGLGVATETGTQGVTREGVPSEEVEVERVVGGERNLDVSKEQNKGVEISELKKQINKGLGSDMKITPSEVTELNKLEFSVLPKNDIDNSDINKPIIFPL